MASTYSSNLYIELIATGEQAGTWGTSTNNNFTNVFEEAIVGRVSVPFSDADVTLTATASNTNQSFRNVYLNCTGTNTASRNLVVPTINKNYIVENNTTGGFSIVVKTSAGTGITVPNGTKCAVYVDGTNVVIAFNYLSTLTVGTLSLTNALTTASGGTGLSSYTAGDLPYYASGTALSKLAIGTNGQILTSSGTAPQWSTLSGVAVTTFQTSLSGLTPSTATAGAVTLAGTLGTSSGGTGLTAFTANQIFYASSTSAIAQSSNLTFNGTTLTANTLNLTNALGVAYGGTGLTTLTSGYIPYGNGTSAFSSASTLSYSSTSGLTVNGITQAYNTTLYNVDGTLSNYASNNAVYLNGNAGGWLLLSGDGTRNQSIKLNGGSSSAIQFLTAGVEVGRFSPAGYLGIGTNSPSYPLQVVGQIYSSGNGASSGYLLTDSGGTARNILFLDSSSYLNINNAYTPGIKFYSNYNTLGMTLSNAGYLGIGTSSPNAQLEIGGYPNATFRIGDGSTGYYQFTRLASDGYLHQNSNFNSTGFIWEIASSEKMRIDSSGNLLVGASAQFNSCKVGIKADIGAYNILSIQNSSASLGVYVGFLNSSATTVGSISYNGAATLYNATSDYRLKNVIGDVTDSGQRIDALKPIEYDWKAGGRTRGFLAHKFAEVYPNSVTGKKDAVDEEGNPVYQAMQASSPEVMADLIAEIQSLRKRVAQLESK